jgi:hypothetical protein
VRDVVVGLAVLVVVGALTATWTAAAYVDDTRVSLHRRAPGSVELTHRGRSFYFPGGSVDGVRAMLDTVERVSRPGDRLLVGPTDLRRTPYIDSVVYYLLPQLRPATRFVYMNPATALHDHKELADDVASADVLVLSSRWNNWREPNESVKFGPDDANKVVRRDFCLASAPGIAASGPPPFEVYRKCR